MIWLFSDVLVGLGGIETYLDALARTLHAERRPFRIAVSLNGPAPFLDDLEALGIDVYRQPRVPGDRFKVRQRLLVRHVARQLTPGDWVFCVRQPMPGVYLPLVRAAHARGAKVAASWIFAPEFLPPPPGRAGRDFCRAVAETDAVVSVSECAKHQYADVYGYTGPVKVVRYHNRPLFETTVPLPPGPPWAIGFTGRIDIHQKNLDTILAAFALVRQARQDVVLNIHGGGPDLERFRAMVEASEVREAVTVHGRYAHDRDLPAIVGANHVFVYTSLFEGGPCFSLLELMQAGRFVVTSPVGGIPDLYEGRPDLGLLTASDDPRAIAGTLLEAVDAVERGAVRPDVIRRAYEDGFSEGVAHRQWCAALGLDGPHHAAAATSGAGTTPHPAAMERSSPDQVIPPDRGSL